MRKCPWCGRENLNVYVYCLGCGRGFSGPVVKPVKKAPRWWPFGGKKAA